MLSGKKAYICSPLSAPTPEGISHNMEMAKFYLVRMKQIYHCRTFASHAHLPLMLDDTIPEERTAALRIGIELMKICNVLIICGRYVSEGMKSEIRKAFEMGMEVNRDRYFSNEDEMIRWIDQPSIVPFLKYIPDKEKDIFRDEIIAEMKKRTQQSNGTYFETFRRLKIYAKK